MPSLLELRSMMLNRKPRRYAFDESEAPILWDTETRDRYLGARIFYGFPGQGKTSAVCYYVTEVPPAPNLGIRNVKRLFIDGGLRCEAGTAFAPMLPSHPLYRRLIAQGREPRGFKMEILSPLTWSQREKDIPPTMQPAVFHPFTFATDGLQMVDWWQLLGIARNRGQRRLHELVLRKLSEDGKLASATVQEMAGVAEGIYTDKRSLPGLLDAYDSLHESGLVLPREYMGEPTFALDMRRILEDTDTISVFYIPPDDRDRPRSYRVLTVILNMIQRLKAPISDRRVSSPAIIGIPEIANLARKKLEESEKDYMEPLKLTIYQLFRTGSGNGISLVTDSQFFRGEMGLDPIVNETSAATGFFYMNKDAIKEMLNNRNIANRFQAGDDDNLTKLHPQGHFLWIGAGSQYAESKAGAIPAFHYARVRMGKKMDTFNWRDLWRRLYPIGKSDPTRWWNITRTYALSKAIIEHGRSEYERMTKERESRKGKKPEDEEKPKLGVKLEMRMHKIVNTGMDQGKAFIEFSTQELAEALGETFKDEDEAKPEEQRRRVRQEVSRSFAEECAERSLCRPAVFKHRAYWRFDIAKMGQFLDKGAKQGQDQASEEEEGEGEAT